MQLLVNPHGEAAVISIVGALDATTADEATNFLLKQIDTGWAEMVIDLSEVSSMSSAGLRAILTTLREARSKQGEVCLAAPRPAVEQVLQMGGLTALVGCYATVDMALESLSG